MRRTLGGVLWLCLVVACSGESGEADAGDGAVMDAGSEDAGAPCADDSECDDGLFCNGSETCGDDGRCVAGTAPDCSDGIECTIDRCDETQRECVSEGPDADDDGVRDAACLGPDGLPLGEDCDDGDANRFPGNPEICDADDHDEDCDDTTYGAVDGDSDGHDDIACCNVSAAGVPLCGDDCNDEDGNVSPSDTEVCNEVDDDCDGMIDEGSALNNYYPDCDGDDFGDTDATPIVGCRAPVDPPVCAGGTWVTVGTDCDDAVPSTFPGAAELCNGVDDNCVGGVDESVTPVAFYPDCDGDDFGDMGATPVVDCAPPSTPPTCPTGTGVWVQTGTDCDDGNVSVFPGATETCNGIDDNCIGGADEGLAILGWLPDCDLDSWGDRDATPIVGCGPPASDPVCVGTTGTWVSRGGDCDETTASVSPARSEVCNGIDDNCNDLADDLTPDTVFCALGDSQACTNSCGVAGTQTCATSCMAWNPCSSTETELCNYCDDDGDGLEDEVLEARETASTETNGERQFECTALLGDATCVSTMTIPSTRTATLIDGSENNQAGLIWFNPIDWVAGHGPTEIVVRMRVRTRPENGDATNELPYGGWAILVRTGGTTTEIGTPEDLGVPRTGTIGLAAEWHWSTLTETRGDCMPSGPVFAPVRSVPDSIRLAELPSGDSVRPSGATDDFWDCTIGTVDVPGASLDLSEDTTSFLEQRMRVVYIQDDPSTTVVNEEAVEIYAGADEGTLVGTWSADDGFDEGLDGNVPPGTPIQIGIAAGSAVAVGPIWAFPPSPSTTYGVPVQAEVDIWTQTFPSLTFSNKRAWLSVSGLCEAPP